MRDPRRIARIVLELQMRVPEGGICELMDDLGLSFGLEDEDEKRILTKDLTFGGGISPFTQLEKTWREVPDWRLGQLWSNVAIKKGANDLEAIDRLEEARLRWGVGEDELKDILEKHASLEE